MSMPNEISLLWAFQASREYRGAKWGLIAVAVIGLVWGAAVIVGERIT